MGTSCGSHKGLVDMHKQGKYGRYSMAKKKNLLAI